MQPIQDGRDANPATPVPPSGNPADSHCIPVSPGTVPSVPNPLPSSLAILIPPPSVLPPSVASSPWETSGNREHDISEAIGLGRRASTEITRKSFENRAVYCGARVGAVANPEFKPNEAWNFALRVSERERLVKAAVDARILTYERIQGHGPSSSEVSAWDIDERKVRLNSIYVLDWSPISTRIEASRHRPGLSIVQFYELCMGNLSVEGLSSREMDFVLTTMAANPDHSGTSVEAYDGLR